MVHSRPRSSLLSRRGRFRKDWFAPSYVVRYQAPQPVFVPIAVPRPAVEPVAVATVTLRSGVTPEAVFVGGGMVVTWGNGDTRSHTLVIAPALTIY